MPDLFSDMIAAFRAVVASAWPEVVPHGIWEADEALMRSFERDMALPYAVIDVASFEPTGDFGVANHTWQAAVSIYYVAETEGDFSGLRERLQALSDALDASPLATGQIFPRPWRMALGRDLEPNSLLILLNATQRAGVVAGAALVGYAKEAA